MTLSNLITQHASPGATAGDWAAVASALNAANVLYRDATPLTYARVRDLLGEPARQAVAATLRAIAASQSQLAGEMADVHLVMLNEQIGLRIDTDDRQSVIDQIATAGGWSDQLRDGVKRLGVRVISVAEAAGYPPVTAVQCQAVWTAEQIRGRRERWDTAAAAVRSQIESGALTTDAEIVTALQSALEG